MKKAKAVAAPAPAESAPTLPPPKKKAAPPPVKKGKKPMVPSLVLPKNDEGVINNLMSREITDPTTDLAPPDPVVKLASEFIAKLLAGKSLGATKIALENLLKHQAEKGEIMQAFINDSYMNDVPDLLRAKDNARRVFANASARKDVTVTDAIAIWKLSTDHLERTRSGVLKPGIKPVDSEHVGKVDVVKQIADKELMLKYANTTPQGREIIRKKLFKLKQELKEAGMVPSKVGLAPSPT